MDDNRLTYSDELTVDQAFMFGLFLGIAFIIVVEVTFWFLVEFVMK